MKYPVKITKVMECVVEIEAESQLEALNIADQMYNGSGAELPEMDDTKSLLISIDSPGVHVEKTKVITGKPDWDDVKDYLARQGYPDPSESLMDEFLNGGENQEMYDEAVRNNYCMEDVDRWFNLKKVFGQPISYGVAMMIDNALWSEEYESMEINSAKEIFDTPEQICKKRIEMLIAVFNKDGTVVPNEYDVQDKDIIILAKTFDIPLTFPQERKASLSSMIGSADLKAAENSIPSKDGSHIAAPER